MAKDVPDLVDWITSDGPPPKSVDDAIFQQDRLRSLRGAMGKPVVEDHGWNEAETDAPDDQESDEEVEEAESEE